MTGLDILSFGHHHTVLAYISCIIPQYAEICFHRDLLSGPGYAQNISMCSGLVELGGGTGMFKIGGARN